MHLSIINSRKNAKRVLPFDVANTHWAIMDGPFTHDDADETWSCPVNTFGAKGLQTIFLGDRRISSGLFGFVAVDMQARVSNPAKGDLWKERSEEDETEGDQSGEDESE